MKFIIRSRDGRTVGRYSSEPVAVEITDQTLHADLLAMQKTGGVPMGPEGPFGWSPNAIVEYLRHDGYELAQEGTDGQQRSDPHVSPDSGRVQVQRDRSTARRGTPERVARVRPGI